ncbi:MAG: hypothetical protein WAX57_02655 [Minisyncoccia bacterium]
MSGLALIAYKEQGGSMQVSEVIAFALPEDTNPRIIRAAVNQCSRKGVNPEREWGPETPSLDQFQVVEGIIAKAARVVRRTRRVR